ncbi:uncharacterized protein PRCAT00000052001 [Priceomyces carsonii]|uniref:uncharacterized protein n=1 Tax=Priceomyces carsonii TaxID=28549 RepID=UPI002ED82EC3|nr:unnamed protein product [Priceomyces carsonii]
MAILFKAHSLPKSTKILLSMVTSVLLLIFLIRFNKYRNQEVKEDGTTLKFKEINVSFLQLVPRFTIYYPWVLATSIFAESTIFSFIPSFYVLLVSSRYLEKFWGYKEVLKFVFIVGTISNLLTVLITIVFNLIRGDVKGMDRPLGGGISYYFGFLVSLKQLIPEHNIILFKGLLNFRVKQLPFILIGLVSCWSLLISRSIYPAVPAINSTLIAFNYLRFYQAFWSDPLLPITTANGDNSNSSFIRGDASDTFRLVEFFPNILKPYLSGLFEKTYDLSVFLGIVTPFNDDIIEQSNLRTQRRLEQASQSQKSVANSVAERRRQVALQVIEDRINKETNK